jgi:glycosyltransferase involved in cell wall biosynthesis
MPAVTIITGLYNSEAYLPFYFKMLQAQTFADWEAILIDDGSKDQTVAMVQRMVAQDPRFKLIQKNPEGSPSRSRAVGLNAATTELVAFVDHDDFWAPQKLELQVALMLRNPRISVCHTQRIMWTSPSRPANMFHYPGSVADMPVSEQSMQEAFYHGYSVVFSSFMGKRSEILAVGFHPDLRGVDDFYLHMRLGLMGAVMRIDLPLTYYYAHDQNLSHANQIFVRGLYAIDDVLRSDRDIPDEMRRAVRAQALRTDAVARMGSPRWAEQWKAVQLMLLSLRTYFIPSTLTRMGFLIATIWMPPGLRQSLFGYFKWLKFRVSNLRDLMGA